MLRSNEFHIRGDVKRKANDRSSMCREIKKLMRTG